MTDQPQIPPRQRPKSLLETHQDEHVLIQALNQYAASHQKPVSQDMMFDLDCTSSSRASLRFLFPKSTSSDFPQPSGRDETQDPAPVASSSANPNPVVKRKEKQTGKRSGIPVSISRRQPVFSEQPSIPKLLELGVKVRDFAYESTLPPVPTVYLQPRQIQPSFPKDVNDPNDPHYVLEEERKKKVYSFATTRKIERTPTEPVLESDLLPLPHRTFPLKIKRTDAQPDLGSQINSEPQSQPLLSHQTLPYDITNTPLSESQPVPGLATDLQQTGPWINTPIVTPNGSLQWPEKPTATSATAEPSITTTMQPKVARSSATSNPTMTSEMNSITDSQAPETMSYSQMGFAHPDSREQALDPDGSAVRSAGYHPSSDASGVPEISNTPSTATRTLMPSRGPDAGRVKSGAYCAPDTSLIPTSSIEPSPRDSPRASSSRSPVRSPTHPPKIPIAGTSKLPPNHSSSEPLSPSAQTSISPRYNLRNKNKRRAESPPPTSPTSAHASSRTRITRSSRAASSPSSKLIMATVSVNSVHLQDKTIPGVVSTGRTMKRTRESGVSTAECDDGANANESASTAREEMRRSKRRNKAS